MIGDRNWNLDMNEVLDWLQGYTMHRDIYETLTPSEANRRDILIFTILYRIMDEMAKFAKRKPGICNTYQDKALRTARSVENPEMLLEESLMGLCGESGEAMDILKKHLFQGHELDREALALELGDVAWYLAVAANALGYDLNDIFDLNLEKLQKRYPNGFDKDKSINRGTISTATLAANYGDRTD